MRRAFSFSMTLAAALGFAVTGWAQTSGAGGAAGGASGSAAAGSAGSAGAASGTAATGRAGAAGVGGNTATTGGATGNNVGTAAGNNPASGAVNPGVRPGANNGIGVGNNFGANSRGRFNGNGLDNNSAAARTGRNNLGPNSETTVNNGAGFNGGISQNPFFNNPAVRRELNMNDTQFNSLNTAYRDAYNTYNQGVNKLGQNLTPDQRAQEMELLENRFNNSFNSSLNTNLTDAQARMRFDQLNRQYMGLNAFNNAAIQSQLKLSPEQRQQIRSLASQWRDQQGTNGVTPDYSQYSQQLNSILTPQQQQTWSQLTGSRFNFGTPSNGIGTGAVLGSPNNTPPRVEPYSPNNRTALRTGAGTEPNGSGTNGAASAGTNNGISTSGTGTQGTSGTGAGTSSGTSSSGTGAATGATGTTGGTGK